jgi:hypothetical protein
MRSLLFFGLFVSSSLFADGQTLEVGTGKAKFNALIQAWGYNDTTATTKNIDYRIRRAELKLSGSVVDNTKWVVMIDPAKSLSTGTVAATNDNKILQDASVTFTLLPNLDLTAGQFKTPATQEGLDSSADIPLVEKSYTARVAGDKRQPGVMLQYKFDMLKLSVSSTNGQKTNADDTNDDKDVTGRLDITVNDSFNFGAFTIAGDSSYSKTKAYWGGNFGYKSGWFGLRGEGVRMKDYSSATAFAYTTAGDVQVTADIMDNFQAVFRGDYWTNKTYKAKSVGVGVNYLMSKNNAKIQAAYFDLSNMNTSTGSYQPANRKEGSLFIVSFQNTI